MSKGPPPVPGGRSPQEREAARRQREERRTGREQRGEGVPEAASAQRPSAAARPAAAPRPQPQRDWLEEARRLTGRDGDRDGDGGGRGRGGKPRLPGRPRGGGRPGGARLVALAALLVLALGLVWFLGALFQPFKGRGGDQVRVVVPRGLGVGQIGDLLERRGVVSSSFFFQLRARLSGDSSKLKPGSYRLRRDMSYGTALAAVERGTPPNIVVVVIPEGRSRREVAPLVNGRLAGSYLGATRRSGVLDPGSYGGRRARDLEGFLFPATYELKRGRSASALVDQQLGVFRQKFEDVDMGYARSKNLSPYEVLTIASLVEREAQVPRERPLIASVIYNRLKQGIPLGIDATVRFVTGNWTRPLRESEIRNPSPYNTRRTAGLPPGPIGSPGLASIQAAAHPARTRYLFYVVKPCGRGQHAFSATDAQFQRDVRRYNDERAKRGGKSPTDC